MIIPIIVLGFHLDELKHQERYRQKVPQQAGPARVSCALPVDFPG
jgi:hypothetical protein